MAPEGSRVKVTLLDSNMKGSLGCYNFGLFVYDGKYNYCINVTWEFSFCYTYQHVAKSNATSKSDNNIFKIVYT